MYKKEVIGFRTKKPTVWKSVPFLNEREKQNTATKMRKPWGEQSPCDKSVPRQHLWLLSWENWMIISFFYRKGASLGTVWFEIVQCEPAVSPDEVSMSQCTKRAFSFGSQHRKVESVKWGLRI